MLWILVVAYRVFNDTGRPFFTRGRWNLVT